MPSDGKALTIEQATTNLQKLISSKLFEFTTIGLQKLCKDVQDLVDQISKDKPPPFSAECSPYVQKLKGCLLWVCRFVVQDSNKKNATIFGADALNAAYDCMHIAMGKKRVQKT